MSLEELKAAYLEAVQAGDYDAASILLQRIQTAQAPEALRAPVQPVPFAPALVTRAEMEQQAAEQAEALTAPRTGITEAQREQERQQEEARALELLEMERARPVQPGAGAVRQEEQAIVPMLRVTRMQRLPVYREVPEQLRASLTPEEIAAFETREPRAGADVQPITTREYYRTPEGALRTPTTGERFVESFAQQQILSEEAARQQAAMQTEELQAALRGERFMPLSATVPGLALQRLTEQRPGQGAGVVETPLQAGLRGASTLGSALLAEGIASGAEALGLESQRLEQSALDPESRRRASDDPAFINRVLENISTGRGAGDELYDIDVVRETTGQIAADLAGEEWREAAEQLPFYAGTGLDVLTPGYFGTLGKAGRALRFAGKPVMQAAKPAAQRTIATRIIDQSNLPQENKTAAIAAIRQTDGSEAAIAEAVQPHLTPLGDDAAQAFATELQSRIPADYVFVTDAVAVPRANATAAREAAQQASRQATQRGTDAQAEYLRTLASLADDTSQEAPGRLAAFSDSYFPGQSGQAVRGAQLNAVQGGTADALRAAADALESNPNRAARTSANNAVRTFEEQAGIAPGTVQRRMVERAPREVADSLPAPLRTQAREADSWAALDVQVRDDALEALRAQAAIDAARAGGFAPRTARDLTNLQVFIRSRNPWVAATQRVNDGQLARWVRAVTAKTPLPPASVARAVEKVRGAADTALRTAEQQIITTARETGSVDRAFEAYLLNNTADMAGESRWGKVLETLYGPPDRTMPQARALLGDLDAVPVTVDNVRRLHAQLQKAGVVGRAPLWASPIRRAMLKASLDEGVRRRLIAEGVALEGRLASPTGGVFGYPDAPQGLPRWSVLASDDPITAQAAGGGARVYSRSASEAEKLLGEAAQELLPYLADVAPAQRTSWVGLAKDTAEYLYGGARGAYYNAKYGFAGLPNLPVLVYRLTEAPILSMATIGTRKTLAALQQMTRSKLDETMRRLGARRMGAGLSTVDGRYYTPAELDRLADGAGIGISRVETERVINLANDLERSARQATRGKAGQALTNVSDQFNPFARGFWLQTAHSVEMSFRRSVFEAALAAGESVDSAADIARRSLGDYSASPEMVQNIGRFFATAQANYLLLSEMVLAAVKNPGTLGAISRTALARQKLLDPYNLDGDESLTRLGIVQGGQGEAAQRFYGPRVPIFAPVEATLQAMRHVSVMFGDIKRATQAATPGQAGEEIAAATWNEGGVPLVSVALPVFGAWLDSQGIESGEPLTLADPVSAERVFWQTMAATRAADPTGELGVWSKWLDIARPEVVKPPQELAHQVLDDVWLRQPAEGTPHILYAYDDEGRPLYKVYKPSPRGLQNIELIRTVTPDALERVFGATAALIDMPAGPSPGPSVEADAPPVQVFGGVQVPRGAGAAAGMLLGQPAGPADPAAARRLQIEQLRQAREGQ